MPRYYFDFADEKGLLVDDEGMDFQNLEAVQDEAARCLADMARDAARTFKGRSVQQMAVKVRDDEGTVLHARISFEIDRKN
jgi:hypothetical protein